MQTVLACVRMATHLNALLQNQISPEGGAHLITGTDVAHHVIDPESILGLDPLRANELTTALARLAAAEGEGWSLALPAPGQLMPLRGPREFNEAALEATGVVIANSAELGLVPHRVGPGVQWRVLSAARPFPPSTPYEAERGLNEAILNAARTLAHLDVAAGSRPRSAVQLRLAPGYPPRQASTADRAYRLLEACEAALADDGGSISSFEADVRARELRAVRDAAVLALCSACSWIEPR